MNPLGWEHATGRLDPNHQTAVNNNMDHASGAVNDWDTYCHYSRYAVDELQSSMGVNLGLKGVSPPSHDFYAEQPEVGDPDGQPLEIDVEDPELARKLKELREIEEQIIRKKASIALKKVEPFVHTTAPAGFSCDEQSATCSGATLKDRVNAILQQRAPGKFLPQVRSLNDRKTSSGLSKHGLPQDDHPLKLRVQALMRQRCNPCVLPANREVPEVTPLPPPSQSVTSQAKENSINRGFERFLSVLNKGVDMDLLSRIVNDDSADLPLADDLLNLPPPAVKDKPEQLLRSDSQRSNSGSLIHSHGKTEPLSQEISLNERPSIPEDEKDEKKNNRGDLCFASSSRSKSPPAVKRKKKKEEKDKPKVDEQQVHLQNILQSLGLSLEVEEMSKLADRTQERLYGKKHEATKPDNRGEQRGSNRHYRNSSSSSSSCSRSTSRSCSSSPSRCRHSNSRDSNRRRTSERSRSRNRSRDGVTCQDGNQDGKDTQKPREREKDEGDSIETSTYEHQYPQNQPYPPPHSPCPDYSSSHYSQYDAYSYWPYTQGPSGHPYPQTTDNNFPGSEVKPDYLDDTDLWVNPDLSKSEGQTGSVSRYRCLQVISPKEPVRTLKQLTISCKRKARLKRKWLDYLQRKKNRANCIVKSMMPATQVPRALQATQVPKVIQQKAEAEQPQEEKLPPTDEEIMANLRKKLEAFNQRAKEKVKQPANSQTG